MKDTKKLNAVIACGYLFYSHGREQLTENQLDNLRKLLSRLDGTPLGKDDGVTQDKIGIQHAIKLIEEYLEEEGV